MSVAERVEHGTPRPSPPARGRRGPRGCVRLSSRSARPRTRGAFATDPVRVCGTRIRPRAAAGDSRTRSEVSTDSTRPARSSSRPRATAARARTAGSTAPARARHRSRAPSAGRARRRAPSAAADVRALPSDHDREVAQNALLDVQPAELARDGRVFLRRVRRAPHIDRDRVLRAVRRLSTRDAPLKRSVNRSDRTTTSSPWNEVRAPRDPRPRRCRRHGAPLSAPPGRALHPGSRRRADGRATARPSRPRPRARPINCAKSTTRSASRTSR